MKSIQGEILNKTTELIKSNFANFFKSVTERNTKTASASSKHHLNCDQNAKLKDYITTFSKTSGASKLQICRPYMFLLLFPYNPTTVLKIDPPMGVKEELKGL